MKLFATTIAFVTLAAPLAAPLPAQTIDTLALEAHAAFLASDALAGRANETPGGRVAVEYIAAQFRRLGLEPAGDSGSYLQAIPLLRVDVDGARTRLIVRQAGRPRPDSIPATAFHHLGGDSVAFRPFRGRLVATGTVGNTLRLLDSLRTLDGTVVVATSGGGTLDSLVPLLEARGATALLLVAPAPEFYQVIRNARGPTRYAVRGERIRGIFATRLPVLLMSPTAAAAFGVAPAPRPAPGAPPPAPTAPRVVGTIALETSARMRPAVAWNVLARLPGRDPARRDEHVALVAHHDHIGIGPAVDGDSIYNGFIDDAVGVAAVLAIAESMRADPPARSTLFFLAGTEEQGSLGSAYWLLHPTVPKVIGAINLDAGAPLAPPTHWYVEGGDASPFGQAAMATATANGWRAESLPMQPTSDHWSFHLAGIPAVFLVPGDDWEGTTAEERDRLIERWWRAHRPNDEWADEFPLAGLARYAEFARKIIYAVK